MEQQQPIDPRRMEMIMKMLEAEEANRSISQNDGVVIRQSEADAPGFYEDQYQMAQDAYARSLLQQQAANAYQQQDNLMYAPPRASAFDISIADMAAGNPNYTVNNEGQNVTVNEAGHIVRY